MHKFVVVQNIDKIIRLELPQYKHSVNKSIILKTVSSTLELCVCSTAG